MNSESFQARMRSILACHLSWEVAFIVWIREVARDSSCLLPCAQPYLCNVTNRVCDGTAAVPWLCMRTAVTPWMFQSSDGVTASIIPVFCPSLYKCRFDPGPSFHHSFLPSRQSSLIFFFFFLIKKERLKQGISLPYWTCPTWPKPPPSLSLVPEKNWCTHGKRSASAAGLPGQVWWWMDEVIQTVSEFFPLQFLPELLVRHFNSNKVPFAHGAAFWSILPHDRAVKGSAVYLHGSHVT